MIHGTGVDRTAAFPHWKIPILDDSAQATSRAGRSAVRANTISKSSPTAWRAMARISTSSIGRGRQARAFMAPYPACLGTRRSGTPSSGRASHPAVALPAVRLPGRWRLTRHARRLASPARRTRHAASGAAGRGDRFDDPAIVLGRPRQGRGGFPGAGSRSRRLAASGRSNSAQP